MTWTREDLAARADEIARRIPEPRIPDRTIDLRAYAGVDPDADGSHDFYADIRRAIAELAEQGGGRLLFSHTHDLEDWARKLPVTYRIRGPIDLLDHIELAIEPSVTLRFEFDPPSYLIDGKPVLTRYEGTTIYSFSPLIRAVGRHDVAIRAVDGNGAPPEITGEGARWRAWAIAGQEEAPPGSTPAYQLLKEINNAGRPLAERIYADQKAHCLRPPIVQFFVCRNVLMEGVKLSDSPFWTVLPIYSENVICRGLILDCQNVNNDGIDPDSCRNVLIERVVFSNRDDNVAIKAGRDREGREGLDIRGSELETVASPYIQDGRLGPAPTEDVVIRDCVFRGHHAVCIGSEASGGVRNILAIDNIAPHEIRSALFIKSSRKRGGEIRDIHVCGLKAHRLAHAVAYLNPNYDNDPHAPYPPHFHDISLSEVTTERAGTGFSVFGWADQPIHDVAFRDIAIRSLDAPGETLTVKQARDITFERVTLAGQPLDGTYTHSGDDDEPPAIV